MVVGEGERDGVSKGEAEGEGGMEHGPSHSPGGTPQYLEVLGGGGAGITCSNWRWPRGVVRDLVRPDNFP
jgi:hypothetical protein